MHHPIPGTHSVYYAPEEQLLDPVSGRHLAPWGRRVGAWLLDDLIIGVPSWIFATIVIGPQTRTTTSICDGIYLCQSVHFNWGRIVAGLALNLVIYLAYFTLLVGRKRGQSVGMIVMRISVRDADVDASVGYRRAFARCFVIWLLGIALVLPVFIDFLSPLWDRRRKAWHDHAIKSIVTDLRHRR
jgi:uncharacterized RDD family membrane protein YckC